MKNRKPLLTTSEQINHLKQKGITFNVSSEDEAYHYLKYNNNFFKLSSYRKNYDKNSKGKYINLDFGYLKDLAIVDMKLRYTIVQMALNIEHYAKMELLRVIEDNHEDGYKICDDFLKSLNARQSKKIKDEIKRNKYNPYCGELFEKYNNTFPVWVFLELIPFGRLVSFYKFCAERYSSKRMINKHFLLKTCKDIRNASAHSSCILNNLRPNIALYSPRDEVMKKLSEIGDFSKQTRVKKMSNSRIQQIATLIYTHNIIVTSEGVKEKGYKLLFEFSERMMKNIDYYDNNKMILSTFNFIDKVIDNWTR
ncbi:MAG: Abi family protein [Eubacterium sp.]|nr:Abi family protein [Eubacterium sp.]